MKLNIQLFGDGEVVIPVNLDTKSFEKQIAKVEYDLDELEETYKLALKDPDFDPKALRNMQDEIERTKNKLIRLQKQQLALNTTTKNYDKSFKNVGSKLAKMGLAIFGIRSAFMLVRQSMNEIAESNDDVANKLNTIKSSLAVAIAPIAEGLVNVVYKLLGYLNVITKTFLGVDLFAKTSKGAKNTAKSLKGASGSAKEIKKQLAGFDEMNVLTDTSSKGGGGTGGGVGDLTPKITPPDTGDFDKVVKKFKGMWDEILEIDRNEAEELLLASDKTWGQFNVGLFDFTQGWIKLFQGFFDTIKGLWNIIVGWATDDDKKIQNGVESVKKGIGRILSGFAQVLFAPWEMAKGLIEGVFKSIVNWVKKKFLDPIYNALDSIKKKIQENFKGGFFKGILNTAIDIFNKVIGKINDKLTISIGSTLAKVLKAIGINVTAGKYSLFTIPKIPKLAQGGIVNMPSRGIPVGSAIAGERGAEGVIPLTDSQQMALLGEAIGRYITINAQITNTMNGRVISRELQKIQQENSFASNR